MSQVMPSRPLSCAVVGLLLVACVAPLGTFAVAAAPEPRRPNILIVMVDQLNASTLSCYGGPVPTPHIDRIAREGVRFNQAVCPTPFCSPTRASVITGMYPHAHGIVTNCSGGHGPAAQEGIHPADVTTESLLHEAGYATHHYGKWHLFGDTLPYYADMYDIGQYRQEMAETFSQVARDDPTRFMPWYTLPLPVEVAPEFQAAVDRLGNRWEGRRYAPFITRQGRLKLPLDQHFDVRFADRTIERIDSLKEKPFMLTCSFVAPHDPNVVPSPYYEAFAPDRIELPANRQAREKRFEKDWSREIVAGLGEPGLREFLRIYYGMVLLIDDQVGRILKALEEAGVLDDTIIVFTADHGDMAGGHGMVWKSTGAFYDEIARVPLLIRYSRRFRPQTSEMDVDLTDLMPTLLSLTGLPIPDQAQGQNLVPYLTGQKDPSESRRFAFSERVMPNRESTRRIMPDAQGSFMIRGQGWKYIRYQRGDAYLYHLTEDPGETKNLADDTRYKSRRDELDAELTAWLRRTGWIE